MEDRVIQLKKNFSEIIDIRNDVRQIFEILSVRINKLKIFYQEFTKKNKSQIFIFGLDSFNFQSKLIDIEYEDMKRLFLAINNRIYCEYFKLYKIIVNYILEVSTDKKILDIIKSDKFPIYKDLEPFKDYKFEITLELHQTILELLNLLLNLLNNKIHELNLYNNKKNIGLNIDNFITSFNYDIIMMKEKINSFLTYIEFFHKLHTKQLKRFSDKIQLMYIHINNDINFDDSCDIKKNELTQNNKNEIFSSPNTPSNFIKSKSTTNIAIYKTNSINFDENDEKIEDAFCKIDSKCDNILNDSNSKNENEKNEELNVER
jgi:hypothetical protein